MKVHCSFWVKCSDRYILPHDAARPAICRLEAAMGTSLQLQPHLHY
ncbi:hypothetical protein H6F74_27835 [Trichocoleus sp. FACHB-90]|nr:hypothetical protein [Trichocoleus sp. FACHB-90]